MFFTRCWPGGCFHLGIPRTGEVSSRVLPPRTTIRNWSESPVQRPWGVPTGPAGGGERARLNRIRLRRAGGDRSRARVADDGEQGHSARGHRAAGLKAGRIVFSAGDGPTTPTAPTGGGRQSGSSGEELAPWIPRIRHPAPLAPLPWRAVKHSPGCQNPCRYSVQSDDVHPRSPGN